MYADGNESDNIDEESDLEEQFSDCQSPYIYFDGKCYKCSNYEFLDTTLKTPACVTECKGPGVIYFQEDDGHLCICDKLYQMIDNVDGC